MARYKVLLALVALLSLAANLVFTARYFIDDRDAADRHSPLTDQPVVIRTEGGLLEVAAIKSPESFEASRDHRILGIAVGATITRIRVPAQYRYHIELKREWKVLLRDKSFIVVAPRLQPTLPVAIDTARLEKQSAGLWSLFTGHAQLDALQRSITQSLAAKAASPVYVQMQREAARKTVAEFVAQWLLTQERWRHAAGWPVRVYFADEPIAALGDAPPPFGAIP